MNTIIKRILFESVLLAVATLAMMAGAAEPIEGYQALSFSTNYCAGSTALVLTNASGAIVSIDSSRQRQVAIRLMIQNDGSGTAANNFYFYPTADGTHYAAAPYAIVGVAASGTTAVEVVTNIDCVGLHALKCGYMTNSGSANTTNFAIGFNFKTQSP